MIHTAVKFKDNIKLKLSSKNQEAIGTELSSGGIASRHQQKTLTKVEAYALFRHSLPIMHKGTKLAIKVPDRIISTPALLSPSS